jgi:hypothetical protein
MRDVKSEQLPFQSSPSSGAKLAQTGARGCASVLATPIGDWRNGAKAPVASPIAAQHLRQSPIPGRSLGGQNGSSSKPKNETWEPLGEVVNQIVGNLK